MLSPEIFPSTLANFPSSPALPSPCSSGLIAPPWDPCASQQLAPVVSGPKPGRDGNTGHLKRFKP